MPALHTSVRRESGIKSGGCGTLAEDLPSQLPVPLRDERRPLNRWNWDQAEGFLPRPTRILVDNEVSTSCTQSTT